MSVKKRKVNHRYHVRYKQIMYFKNAYTGFKNVYIPNLASHKVGLSINCI